MSCHPSPKRLRFARDDEPPQIVAGRVNEMIVLADYRESRLSKLALDDFQGHLVLSSD
jgi:hypothetical protein